MRTDKHLVGAIALAATAGLVLAACQDDGDGGTEGSAIVFWTPHNTPQRLALQEQIADDFTEQTGIEVDVVGLDASDANQAIVSGAASGDVPDVVLHRPDQTAAWLDQGLLDAEAAQEVLDSLGPETFSDYALDLVTLDGELQAVPSDGWGQFLFYRTDLFDDAGVQPPQSLADIAPAAAQLGEAGHIGVVLGTAPGDDFTTQTLETFALTNDCQLFTGADVTLDSPECVNALGEYQAIVAESVGGEQDVESTRAAYLSGDAAMTVWSSHFLDELAGLDQNFPVTCPECADNAGFLAENTGVVGLLSGPDNTEATTYGITLNLGIMRGADTEAAQQWVEHALSDGYIQHLATATEGRIPVRTGTAEDPQAYVQEWMNQPLGAEPQDQIPFDEVYSQDVIDAVIDGANGFSRWGLGTEHAATAGVLAAQNALAEDLQPLFDGADPQEVTQAMQSTAEAVAADSGE
ncbi:MAG TPA: extracellular solute-binding protein [Beutenbergiaceae bacterium]|nr:extracellular solute-binding protein [Beutenbergiaceae bacterium]